MSDLQKRALQLVTLATDKGASEHEARNAAVQACKIIAEHKLLGEPPAGLGSGFATFLSALPIERIMSNVNTMAIGASALEIISLKAEIETLRSENERLRSKKTIHVSARRRR